MNLNTAEMMAKAALTRLAKQYPSLEGWSFKWNTRKTALGLCVFSNQTIQLSKLWSKECSTEEVLDTILHEIAHAIAGYEAGHGPAWKRVCRDIGANPERMADLPMELLNRVREKASLWVLVYAPEAEDTPLQVIRHMHRMGRPLYGMGVIGRPETKGRLYYIPTERFGKRNERMYLTKGKVKITW